MHYVSLELGMAFANLFLSGESAGVALAIALQ